MLLQRFQEPGVQIDAPEIVPLYQYLDPGAGGGGGGETIETKPGIDIVNINTNIINQLRRTYATRKKDTTKRLTQSKKRKYNKRNDAIKKLPVKERKAARAKLRESLKKEFAALSKQLPSIAKLKLTAKKLKALIATASALKSA